MAVIEASDKDFQTLLEDNPKVFVKYQADWCGQCRLFAPKYKKMAADEQYSDIVFLDVNAEESPEARKAAGVDNLPFFAAFKDGKMIAGDFTSKKEKVEEIIGVLV